MFIAAIAIVTNNLSIVHFGPVALTVKPTVQKVHRLMYSAVYLLPLLLY